MDDVRVTRPAETGYSIDELSVGMTATYAHTVTEGDVVKFADISGDHNPVHLDEDFARSSFPRSEHPPFSISTYR